LEENDIEIPLPQRIVRIQADARKVPIQSDAEKIPAEPIPEKEIESILNYEERVLA
jgi:small-conductance mechanosensitive channel